VILGSQADVDRLLNDFGGFFDAVVIGVTLALRRSRAKRAATVRILAEEGGTGASDRWRSVDFQIEGLRDFRFEETPKTSHHVLSMGLRVYLLEETLLLDLAPESEESLSLNDLRRSSQYVAGESCTVELGEAPADV
jgi:hypothetical protein